MNIMDKRVSNCRNQYLSSASISISIIVIIFIIIIIIMICIVQQVWRRAQCCCWRKDDTAHTCTRWAVCAVCVLRACVWPCRSVHTWICSCIFAHLCVCVCVCMHVWCVCVCGGGGVVCVCACACMCVCVCVCFLTVCLQKNCFKCLCLGCVLKCTTLLVLHLAEFPPFTWWKRC